MSAAKEKFRLLAQRLKTCPSLDTSINPKLLFEIWKCFRSLDPEQGDEITPAIMVGIILFDEESFGSLLTEAELTQLVALASPEGEVLVTFQNRYKALDALSARFTEAGVPHCVADGRTSQKRRGVLASQFKLGLGRSPYPVMLAGVECMAEGHSFPLCNSAIKFKIGQPNPGIWQQCPARTDEPEIYPRKACRVGGIEHPDPEDRGRPGQHIADNRPAIAEDVGCDWADLLGK